MSTRNGIAPPVLACLRRVTARFFRLPRSMAGALVLAAFAAAPAAAATFNVNSTIDAMDADTNDGLCNTAGNECTLRAAIMQASALGGVNQINVPAGTYLLSAALGRLVISGVAGNLTITGTGGPGTAIIDGQNAMAILDVQQGTATLDNLVIQRGFFAIADPGGFGACVGPALFVEGTGTVVNVTSSLIQNNAAPNGSGGAICVNTGTLNLDRSTVRNNTTTYGGGAIRVLNPPTTLNVTDSTISGNTVTDSAGGGGGIETQAAISVVNSTISGNTAHNVGSAISAETGITTLDNVTIAGNGGAPQLTVFNASAVTLASTIIANPNDGANCSTFLGGVITSLGHNLDSANNCGFIALGDLVNTDPLLGPLVSNGGPTATQALLPGSPAIDAGSNPLALATDQRGAGFARVDGSSADIGAYEWITGSAPTLQSAVSRKIHSAAGPFDLPLALTPGNPTIEPRKGPIGTVVLTFNKPIDSATATITEGVATAGTPSLAGNTVSVDLTDVADEQYVTLTLTDVESADGGSGGTGAVRIGLLMGDVNQNRVVTVSDLLVVNASLTQPISASNYLRDVNLSGTLLVSDLLLVNSNQAQNLPPP